MAHGEFWIAKEIYRREVVNLRATIPEKEQDERLKIVIQWLEDKIKELDLITSGKKPG
jgi:lauroyl/myristoyl acyltransferase